MSLFGNLQDSAEFDSVSFELGGFLAEKHRIENHAITDDVGDSAFGEYARGNRAEHMLVSVELKCVPCIRAALEACHNIVIGGEDIDYFTFAFVSPLET